MFSRHYSPCLHFKLLVVLENSLAWTLITRVISFSMEIYFSAENTALLLCYLIKNSSFVFIIKKTIIKYLLTVLLQWDGLSASHGCEHTARWQLPCSMLCRSCLVSEGVVQESKHYHSSGLNYVHRNMQEQWKEWYQTLEKKYCRMLSVLFLYHFHILGNFPIDVICSITQWISSWMAFWNSSLGTLSSLAILSHSVLNCHLSRTSPLSVFEMTTTSFCTEYLYNQFFSSYTTLVRCFVSGYQQGESIFLHSIKSSRPINAMLIKKKCYWCQMRWTLSQCWRFHSGWCPMLQTAVTAPAIQRAHWAKFYPKC